MHIMLKETEPFESAQQSMSARESWTKNQKRADGV